MTEPESVTDPAEPRRYYDSDGNERTIYEMVRLEPEWAANIIQAYAETQAAADAREQRLVELVERCLPFLEHHDLHRYESQTDRCKHYEWEPCDCGLIDIVEAFNALLHEKGE